MGDRKHALKGIRETTAGFVATLDAPETVTIPELLEIYPEAKVVLVLRDPVSNSILCLVLIA